MPSTTSAPLLSQQQRRIHHSLREGRRLLISPAARRDSRERMGVKTTQAVNVGALTERQREYLEWHEEFVFLQSRRGRGQRAESATP